MFLLSPAKLLVVLVVALLVLGPDKLPKVARQVGSVWNDFRRLRQKLESEVRGTFPDLPDTETITRAVRSPLGFLDSLATEPTEPAPPAVDTAPRRVADDVPTVGDRSERSGPTHPVGVEGSGGR